MVGKDEFSSRVRQGRIVDQNRQSGTRLPLRKGFSVGREPIPMVADGVASSPTRSARSAGTGGQVRPDRHERVGRGSVERVAGGPQPPLIDRQKEIALAFSSAFEYDPPTAFASGSPEQADPAVLAGVLARAAAEL